MKKHYLLILLCSFLSYSQNYTLSGYIEDVNSGESLIGANIAIDGIDVGCSTNNYGFFSVTIPMGEYKIISSYIGYKTKSENINLNENKSIVLYLNPELFEIEEVTLSTKSEDYNVKSANLGKIELEVKKLEQLPVLMGEKDVLKSIQLLPGIQSGNEGSAGFYVRGGGVDQNLILLDEATIYNASHLFGFFSVFNSDAINDINLIKGSPSSNYGGRLASVLDINMKNGNKKKFEANGGIGLISSRLTVEGPIKVDTSSFIVSARRTYIDVLTKPYLENTEYAGNGYYFYDLTAKINYKFSDKDQLFFSGYFGRDVFSFSSSDWGFSINMPWGNATSSVRWNHVFSNKLFMNTSLIFSDYKFEFNGVQEINNEPTAKSSLFSGIKDWALKQDFNYYLNSRHTVKFGINNIYHEFTPSSFTAEIDSIDFSLDNVIKYYAHEYAFYINDEYKFNEKLLINSGIRFSGFTHYGPFERYLKDDSGNIGALSTDSVLIYKSGEKIKSYFGWEPRISLRHLINDSSSIKIGFNQNYQYIHLTSLSASSLPTDVWLPSSSIVKPQLGRQYSIGYYKNFLKNKYETSIEGYYKTMNNLIEYKDNYIPGIAIGTDNPDNNLTSGKGKSYGLEFFVGKNSGNLTGWIGYTISKTTRKFETLNNGNIYFSKFDRTHDLSCVINYQISERLNISSVFVYASGNTFTLPEQAYLIDGQILIDWGDRNSYRMDPYHRMDLSLTLKGKKNKKFESNWSISVYNIYNRQNPYFIYFDIENSLGQEGGSIELVAKQVSLFPIIPSISWNFKF